MEFKNVLSPISIGSMEVRNRFVVPPMGTNFADENGFVTQQMIDYYTARAKGGFGLLILEVTAIDPGGRSIHRQVGVWSDEHIEGLRRLTDAVHQYGAKMVMQLHHAGRETNADITKAQPVAPSAVPCPIMNVLPRELTTEECWELIEKFGDGARRAKAAGFDGIEVHGAHGYLIGQFISAHSNKRTDEFGGDLRSRMNFPLEIVKNIRRKLGSGYPILFRFNTREFVPDGTDIEQAKIIATMMERAGVDALHASLGVYASLEWISAPGAVPAGFNAFAAAEIKKVVSIPVIAVGKINDPYLAESIIASGQADLVSMGRASIADPEIPNKTAGGAIEEIFPCIACEQSCHGYLNNPEKPGISCLINPQTGREGTHRVKTAATPKKVMIVGSGAAGLFAAMIAGKAGHNVTVFDSETALGGRFRIAGIPPSKQDIIKAIKFYHTMGLKYGVEYVLGTTVTAETIRAEAPDVIILGTGAKPLMPPIKGIDNPGIIHSTDIIDGKKLAGSKVLIAGGGMVGLETAEYLAERDRDVTVIDMLPQMGTDVMIQTLRFTLRRFKERGVKLLPGYKIKEFLPDGVIAVGPEGEKRLTGFDTVVLSLGAVPYNPLEEEARKLVKTVHVIGDAVKVAQANNATEQALSVAINL